jgi:hypothetical protein
MPDAILEIFCNKLNISLDSQVDNMANSPSDLNRRKKHMLYGLIQFFL